jgi:hypothetical protein
MSGISKKFLNAASVITLAGALLTPHIVAAFDEAGGKTPKKPAAVVIGPHLPVLTPQDHALRNPFKGELPMNCRAWMWAAGWDWMRGKFRPA